MRIIAGNLGGRLFASPHGHRTHPMSDKMRGALFNSLQDIDGCSVLDAFAGSGALGFEALSRGAASIVAIESDRLAQRTITENVRDLSLQNQYKLIQASASAWLSTSDSKSLFDIILLDPPYDRLQIELLQQLTSRLAADGRLVLSWPGGQEPPQFGLTLIRSKQYGDASLHYYIGESLNPVA